jgi:predicted nucleotidyltransferase component of viral defense system
MLSERSLHEFAIKQQTTESNIAREYLQHLYLSFLYQQKHADKLAFKGGTALRIIYGSPRFSEDLDFSANTSLFHIKDLLETTVQQARLSGFQLQTFECKETSGGLLAVYETPIYAYQIRIELNISIRQKSKFLTEPHLISSPLYPAYTLMGLKTNILVSEKIEALLSRQKPRDFFDAYYILRNRIAIDAVIPCKQKIIKIIGTLNAKALAKELKLFLPKSYWNLTSNFPAVLAAEFQRL